MDFAKSDVNVLKLIMKYYMNMRCLKNKKINSELKFKIRSMPSSYYDFSSGSHYSNVCNIISIYTPYFINETGESHDYYYDDPRTIYLSIKFSLFDCRTKSIYSKNYDKTYHCIYCNKIYKKGGYLKNHHYYKCPVLKSFRKNNNLS